MFIEDTLYSLQGNTTLADNMNATWAWEDPEPVICMFYNPDFILYSSLGSFYIPCLIMIVLYTRIFKVGVMEFSKLLSLQGVPEKTHWEAAILL